LLACHRQSRLQNYHEKVSGQHKAVFRAGPGEFTPLEAIFASLFATFFASPIKNEVCFWLALTVN